MNGQSDKRVSLFARTVCGLCEIVVVKILFDKCAEAQADTSLGCMHMPLGIPTRMNHLITKPVIRR